MARRRAALCCAVAAAWLVAVAAAARAADRIELDGTRSRAEFRVKVVWLVGVRGRFESVHGSVEVDRFRSQAVVDARIDIDSVRMNARGYENWVKSPEFFDAGEHPQIHFVSEPFPLLRLAKGGELPGELTVRGISRPVTLTLEAATCARPGYDCAIVASGIIHRSMFGMRSRLGSLSDKVELGLSVYAEPSAATLLP